jgi:hypothetical protein
LNDHSKWLFTILGERLNADHPIESDHADLDHRSVVEDADHRQHSLLREVSPLSAFVLSNDRVSQHSAHSFEVAAQPLVFLVGEGRQQNVPATPGSLPLGQPASSVLRTATTEGRSDLEADPVPKLS